MAGYIQLFEEGSKDQVNELGGKGANLAEMASLGLPIPKGFTIKTGACVDYLNQNLDFQSLLEKAVSHYHLISEEYPILVSVRSGARVSMAGMMDTILNVGLTTETLPYWKDQLGDRTALDCYRRLIEMYSTVVNGLNGKIFHDILDGYMEDNKVTKESELSALVLEYLIADYQLAYEEALTIGFPDTIEDQLAGTIQAVFESWNNQRAKDYRQIHGIPEDWGTAVNVQEMVFGNLNDKSGSGVMFTRNPSSGAPEMMGEFLVNCQGEDVVAGTHTPMPIFYDSNDDATKDTMEEWNNEIVQQLHDMGAKLEAHYKDVQDIEFTVQDGKLFLLQTRNAKRTFTAACRIAYEMYEEQVLSKSDTLKKIEFKHYLYSQQWMCQKEDAESYDTKGLPAGGGTVTGVVCLNPAKVTEGSILVRKETVPEDVHAMNNARGILTTTGGSTSHAAVVARGLGTPCVVGAEQIIITEDGVVIGLKKLKEGDEITIDGDTGRVWFKKLELVTGMNEYLTKLEKLAETTVDAYGRGYTVEDALNNKLMIMVRTLDDIEDVPEDLDAYLCLIDDTDPSWEALTKVFGDIQDYHTWLCEQIKIKTGDRYKNRVLNLHGSIKTDLKVETISLPEFFKGKEGFVSAHAMKEVFGNKTTFNKAKSSMKLKGSLQPEPMNKYQVLASCFA